jgi:hypothetical protein
MLAFQNIRGLIHNVGIARNIRSSLGHR